MFFVAAFSCSQFTRGNQFVRESACASDLPGTACRAVFTAHALWETSVYHLGSLLVDGRPIINAVKYMVVSGVVWTNSRMVSSNTETNRTGVLAEVDISDSLLICLKCHCAANKPEDVQRKGVAVCLDGVCSLLCTGEGVLTSSTWAVAPMCSREARLQTGEWLYRQVQQRLSDRAVTEASDSNISECFSTHLTTKSELYTPKPDMRGRKSPPNKTPQERKEEVAKCIKSLPAVPSHYCHQSTNRLYLPVEFKNISNVYRFYREHAKENNFILLKNKCWRTDYNIDIHCPKKDKYKVLNAPQGEQNMILYYSWMYAVYNFTFHESSTREDVIYAVRFFLNNSRNIVSVSISYLIPGHMCMPVDSIHACSDSLTKKKSIWTPSECPTIVRNSRTRLGPYNVIVLTAHSETGESFKKPFYQIPKLAARINSARIYWHLRQIRSESPISTSARTPVLLVSLLELTIVLLVHTTPDTTLYFTAFIIGRSAVESAYPEQFYLFRSLERTNANINGTYMRLFCVLTHPAVYKQVCRT
ncbi:hypothetical protein PR048_026516 [Dryococelus australis]|uniref:Uncharacterized protein n=1 Tax=Dryococelus australis TaxID=614101 RepID=A0ABQ9GLL2_9NEOP|nr:hypothetical protein PR048_026516 [Dryococelus australis]